MQLQSFDPANTSTPGLLVHFADMVPFGFCWDCGSCLNWLMLSCWNIWWCPDWARWEQGERLGTRRSRWWSVRRAERMKNWFKPFEIRRNRKTKYDNCFINYINTQRPSQKPFALTRTMDNKIKNGTKQASFFHSTFEPKILKRKERWKRKKEGQTYFAYMIVM